MSIPLWHADLCMSFLRKQDSYMACRSALRQGNPMF